MPVDAFLDHVEAIAPLSAAERAALGQRLRVRRLAPGEALARDGDRCDVVAYVGQGVLRLLFPADGDERTVYFATDGQTVSDYESVLTGAPARMRVEAVEPSVLAILDRETLAWAYASLRHGERVGRLIAERLFLETHRRLTSFYLETAEARYRRLVAEQPDLMQRVPQHLIASYVGVRPPSLSRIRSRIARGGSSPG